MSKIIVIILCALLSGFANSKDDLVLSEEHYRVANELKEYLEKHNNNGLLPKISNDIQVANNIYELTDEEKYLSDYKYFWSFKANQKVCENALAIFNYYHETTVNHFRNIWSVDNNFRGYIEESLMMGFLIKCFGNQINLIEDTFILFQDMGKKEKAEGFLSIISGNDYRITDFFSDQLNASSIRKPSHENAVIILEASVVSAKDYIKMFSLDERRNLLNKLKKLKVQLPKYNAYLEQIESTVLKSPCEKLCQYLSTKQTK